MKLLLDENITILAQGILSNLGYDVESVQSLGMRGMTDRDVFMIAQTQRRVLLTQNGKDFITQVPL